MVKPSPKSSFAAPLILFCISPLLFLPYVIRGMRRGEKWAFLLFALFLGLWAWLTIPFADLFRHSEHYFEYFGEPFSVIWEQYSIENGTIEYDVIIPVIDWIMVNNGIPFQFLRFCEISLSFLLMYSVFEYMLKHSATVYSQADVWKRFMIFALFFEVMSLISGVRYGMAVCFYVYGLHCWYNRKKRILAILFMVLAVGTHMSFSVLVPLSIVTTVLLRNRKTTIVFLLIATPIFGFLMSGYSDILGIRAKWYLDEGNSLAGTAYSNVSAIGFIVILLRRAPALFFGYLAWQHFDAPRTWVKTALIWTILAICFSSNDVLWLRMSWILGTMGIFTLLDIERQGKLKEGTIRLAIVAGMVATLGGGLYHKTILAYSHYEFLVRPIPMIYEHQYSKAWMYYHIDNNDIIRDTRGDFVK